jgi:glutamate-1-semialdehyde 2,1-aminomutase
VISGFRAGRGGMAEALGIRPDLITYGKVIGGGFPVAAYAGRADLLDLVAPVGPVYQAGTLSANPVGMRAGLATLMKMERLDGWHKLDIVAATFVDELRTRFRTVPNAPTIVHHGSLFWLLQNSGEPVRSPERIDPNHAAWYAKFFHAALKRGVYLPPAAYEVGFLSLAHDAAALAHAVSALAEAATEIAQ